MKQAIQLLAGKNVSSQVFEEFIMDEYGYEGFLPKSESDLANKNFWLMTTRICCWFGAIAAEINNEFSYLREDEYCDSMIPIFHKLCQIDIDFLPSDYVFSVLNYIINKYPFSEKNQLNLDFVKAKNEYLSQRSQRD
jgi:hypothetical protein